MPLAAGPHDHLPYVDEPLDNTSAAAARALVAADMRSAAVDPAQPHPALEQAARCTPVFSASVQRELARLDADPASTLKGIDLTRYEHLDAPSDDGDTPERLLERWNAALRQSYTSAEHVQGRLTQLALLEKFGKNAWLVGNAQLEDVLRAIEAELAAVRKQLEDVEALRKARQDSVHGEIKTLEHTWKKGVGRVLETEVAAEGLKLQILHRRRAGAV